MTSPRPRLAAPRVARGQGNSPATDNPQGVPGSVLDVSIAALQHDRPRYFANGTIIFFSLGSQWPQPSALSSEQVQWALRLIMQSSPYAARGCMRAHWQTDFRPDMRAFTVPTLIIHGDNDRSAPLELFGRRTAQAIPGSQLNVYEGAPHGLFLTDTERLNHDLLAFIQG
jgi:non-heme chloroperoxidase